MNNTTSTYNVKIPTKTHINTENRFHASGLICIAVLLITTASIGIHYRRSCEKFKDKSYGTGGKLSSPLNLFMILMIICGLSIVLGIGGLHMKLNFL